MKTAEEWRAQLDLSNIREVVLLPWERWIKAIQLDAELSGYERGVREAANLMRHNGLETKRSMAIFSLLTKKEDAK